ncbi:hypothetical protein IQB76_13800 [Leptospira borgpetersenii serovar Hardjo-bovis]|uniref:Uncharacterized protein n=1 Tax=Leptospira borgpetersenii serovar Hardjo-bovis str. Sponselee TaxID=1303729 RepID=M6BLZ7_LEPBO|nr:hypothetical protein [Leptospira borgpetersenii]AWV69131.1 hypothetical protein B9T54_02280 [Leptospira borgpetersenii serovar Hardjo-bovis]AYR07545.1 hypothetical protein D1609_02265 [Leptospira borgpetersenii serovar Hardjo-bovis]EMJ80772.1 hypothetical protein LEP1GSC016_3766 [Leptospira borgpetersenii serovar Hardjo-bovis str. Sponselee]MBE8351585.1 hypothetical protein [Leptospira borgpetersenii serovar Hardjo-bovis]MBE8371609.1 hypothetical protein [Leptospira borgpetersenii serovar H
MNEYFFSNSVWFGGFRSYCGAGLMFFPLFQFRQNGAPSGLEKRGLDASIYHKTKKPTEGTQ